MRKPGRKEIQKRLEVAEVFPDKIICHKDGTASIVWKFLFDPPDSVVVKKMMAALPGATLIETREDRRSLQLGYKEVEAGGDFVVVVKFGESS